MKFTYAPEGADPRTWDYDPDRLLNAEMEVIERKTGMTFAEFRNKINQGSVLAVHALLWVLLKRKDPTLKWEQVEFTMGEVGWQYSDAEVLDARRRLTAAAAAGELDDSEGELLDALGGPLEDEEPVDLGDVPDNPEDIDWEKGGPVAPGEGEQAPKESRGSVSASSSASSTSSTSSGSPASRRTPRKRSQSSSTTGS